MHDAETLLFRHESLYKILLLFYPEKYRKRFAQEMLFDFRDLYKEEIVKHGRVGISFWLSLLVDTVSGLVTQHLNVMKKQGIKNYFHITGYNIIGGILLLPFLTLFGLDLLGRLAQGDLTHYNRAWYSVISHIILYSTFNGHAYLLWIILIFAPLAALVLNLIPVLTYINKRKKISIKKLLLTNPLAIAIAAIGIFALVVVYGHDFFPCIVHGLLNGAVNKESIIAICRNA